MLPRNICSNFFTLPVHVLPLRYAPKGSMGLLGCFEDMLEPHKKFVLTIVLLCRQAIVIVLRPLAVCRSRAPRHSCPAICQQ